MMSLLAIYSKILESFHERYIILNCYCLTDAYALNIAIFKPYFLLLICLKLVINYQTI